jgi:8-oxo-dGTP pyrophosphatase MutT (NUDIX family)
MLQIKKKKNKSYMCCTNCGKKGHEHKMCKEAITSNGIIVIKFDRNINKKELFINNNKNTEINISGIRANDMKDIEFFSRIKDDISFMMLRRKHNLGYIEFIRGRYKPDNYDGVIFLFQQMNTEEIKRISKLTFDELWDEFWGDGEKKHLFEQEYLRSKEKFNILKENKIGIGLDFYTTNVKPTWDQAEWGFPKGRRNKNEDNLECAIREFQEETGFKKSDIVLVENIEPLVEEFIGTNGIKYKHIYYIAISTNDKEPSIDANDLLQSSEVGAIEYVTYDAALKLIRPYHTARRNLITKLYNYVLNKLMTESNG